MKTASTRYADAIRAGLCDAMRLDPSVFVFGIGVDGKSGVFGTTYGLVDEFGAERVFDTPISEQGLTALAAGAANAGLRPVLVHQRFDFSLYAMDQIANWISLWRYISGGVATMPLTIRVIVGKGWGQGAQHAKSLHAWFAHLPGMQVVMPATPADAKGLLIQSIFSDDPTLFVEARSLFSMEEEVPVAPYRIALGKACVRRQGTDISIVAMGSMAPNALDAADILSKEGVSAEVLDLRTVAPLDIAAVLNTVRHTGRLVVCEPGWGDMGVAAEILAAVSERAHGALKAPPTRVAWPRTYSPTSSALEGAYYPGANEIVTACRTAVFS